MVKSMDEIVHIMRRVANQWDMVIGELFKKPFYKLFLSIQMMVAPLKRDTGFGL